MSTPVWTLGVIYGPPLAVVMPATIREVTRRNEEDR